MKLGPSVLISILFMIRVTELLQAMLHNLLRGVISARMLMKVIKFAILTHFLYINYTVFPIQYIKP